MKYNVLVMVLSLFCASCAAHTPIKNATMQGTWSLELQHNDIGFVRTSMLFETDNGTFEAATRKNADKDILGGWKATLGRTFTSSFKQGSLLHIEKGIYEQGKDTLHFAGILVSAMGNYNLDGFIANEQLYATLSNKSQGIKGRLKGNRKQRSQPLEDYPALFAKAVDLTEQRIYNKDVLRTKEWKDFVKEMKGVSGQVQDDLEMIFAFFYCAGKLPLSHYALLQMPDETAADKDQHPEVSAKQVTLEEKSGETAYMKIASFSGTAAEMDSTFALILRKGYKNLVVDLRNNPGGSVEAGMAFAAYLADSSFYGGIFLTQQYFNKHKTLPTTAEYSEFPHFSAANFDLIIEGIHNTEGLCLKVIPKENVYKGALFILTNGKTASTCEPIVYGFKQQKRGRIIGTRTAGAMLNGEIFPLQKDFKMVIPTADYYTADGYRIDQQGVLPDIEVKQDALEYVLNNLIE